MMLGTNTGAIASRRARGVAAAIALTLGFGCNAASEVAPERREGPVASRTVTQGGAQDIGYFRSLVEQGDVPEPSTLEPVGFFAEHAVDLPPADCGQSICVHPLLAVAPGIDQESNWTMAFVALNSPVDPRELERPNAHIVLVVEQTALTARTIDGFDSAVRAFANELQAGDRVSVVAVSGQAQTLAREVAPTDPRLAEVAEELRVDEAIEALVTGSAAAVYDGLAITAQLIEDAADFDGVHRVVLITSGNTDAGISDHTRIVGLSDAMARQGVGVSVVGVGELYRPELALRISEGGGGTYSYAQSPSDLENVMRLEGRTSLFPLATDFELTVEAAPGYSVGRIYGARRAWAEQITAHLESPVLMVGNRTGSEDIEEGRRGGGGGLFVELLVDPRVAADLPAGAPAFTVNGSWLDAVTGERVTTSATVENGLAPGENPSGMFPHFSDPARGKAFMMLNMYLSLRTTTELYYGGGCGQALGVVPAMEATYEGWQAEYDDPDIAADWALLQALDTNVSRRCAGVEPVAPDAPMSCFYD